MGKNRQEQEEERRIYYVAMTRARETLCLFERKDVANFHTQLIEGDFLLTRDLPKTVFPEREVLSRRYDILGMEDLFLDFAGRRQKEDPIHAHLSSLKSGDLLRAVPRGDHVDLHDVRNTCVAQLSKRASESWHGRLDNIEQITVLAMVHRRSEDSREEFRGQCRSEHWEVPVVEVVYRNV